MNVVGSIFISTPSSFSPMCSSFSLSYFGKYIMASKYISCALYIMDFHWWRFVQGVIVCVALFFFSLFRLHLLLSTDPLSASHAIDYIIFNSPSIPSCCTDILNILIRSQSTRTLCNVKPTENSINSHIANGEWIVRSEKVKSETRRRKKNQYENCATKWMWKIQRRSANWWKC